MIKNEIIEFKRIFLRINHFNKKTLEHLEDLYYLKAKIENIFVYRGRKGMLGVPGCSYLNNRLNAFESFKWMEFK